MVETLWDKITQFVSPEAGMDWLKRPRFDSPDRKASLQGRSQAYNILDNIIGLDDDRVTPGEAFGAGLRNDPVGLISGMVQGANADLQNIMFEGGAMQRPEDVLMMAAAPMAPNARGLLSNVPDVLYSNPIKKEVLDPLGYQQTKMRGFLSDTDVTATDTGENLARIPMSWEGMEGKVVLPFYGDRTARGLLVEGVNDVRFDEPVYTEGGVDFMRGPAAQIDDAIWASNQNIITRLANEAEAAARENLGRDVVGVTGSMAPDANDFATMTGASMAELVKGAKITKKAASEFDRVMKAIDPTFVGVKSPDLRNWAVNASSPMRKTFIRLMDSAPMQSKGFPSPAEARYSVTDPTQRDMPAGMFGLGAARIDTSAPLLYNTPKGNMPAASVPHSTYNTQITGEYLGSLPPVPQGLLFRDVYDELSGKLTKSGQPLNEAHRTHAIKTKIPAQVVTPEVLDGIMHYLESLER
jgi:hypothetical protein